jgi:Imidazolonepropionase and related amidohydrolases
MMGLGMAAIDALKSATSNDAELLGIAQKVGTLEKGKLADIIAMPGDPIADITDGARFVRDERGQNYQERTTEHASGGRIDERYGHRSAG